LDSAAEEHIVAMGRQCKGIHTVWSADAVFNVITPVGSNGRGQLSTQP
jgi:hypothetical protein